MWAGKKVANKRTTFNFSKIESVEKIDLDNSKKLFLHYFSCVWISHPTKEIPTL